MFQLERLINSHHRTYMSGQQDEEANHQHSNLLQLYHPLQMPSANPFVRLIIERRNNPENNKIKAKIKQMKQLNKDIGSVSSNKEIKRRSLFSINRDTHKLGNPINLVSNHMDSLLMGLSCSNCHALNRTKTEPNQIKNKDADSPSTQNRQMIIKFPQLALVKESLKVQESRIIIREQASKRRKMLLPLKRLNQSVLNRQLPKQIRNHHKIRLSLNESAIKQGKQAEISGWTVNDQN